MELPEPFFVNVLGVKVSHLNQQLVRARILRALDTGERGYVCVTGVHGVSEAQDDPEFKEILNSALLNTPDGMPLVWAGKLYGLKKMDRVYGPDTMLNICKAGVKRKTKHFFYGGKEGVADLLKEKLQERIPGLQVVGTYCPPFRPLNDEEETVLKHRIIETEPDIIWVGLSTPKQERFMAEYLPKLDTQLMFGVGAAFDFHTGLVPQAPKWMQNSGLEWVYRLCKEPRRLWWRYLKNNPLFILRISLQLIGARKYSVPRS